MSTTRSIATLKTKLSNGSVFFLLYFTTLLSFTTPVFAGGVFPSSTVQLSWFYKPPTDGTIPTSLLKSFQNFILTRDDEKTRDQLKASGAQVPFLQYVRFDAIQDPGNGVCPNSIQPSRNQVAWTIGDFCSIQTQHPDWILRDVNGKVISVMEGSQRFVRMNPANTGWRDFWLSRVKQSQETLAWDGLLLDNVPGGIDWYSRNNIQLMNFPSDASLQSAVVSFLSQIYNSYFYPQNRPLHANIIELPWASETTTWLNYLQYLDGAMQEDFAVGWRSGSYKTPTEWLDQMNRMEQSQRLGKRVTLVSQGDQSDLQRQQFAFASYLLISKGDASFRYGNSNFYDKVWPYTNYTTALGAPSGSKYFLNSAWRRDFANGYVLAYPDHHIGEIVLSSMAAPPPPPLTPIHVSKLTTWYTNVANSSNFQITTEVRVTTDSGSYPSNATVTLATVLPNLTQSVSIVDVDQYGFAQFNLQSPLKGTYTTTVTNLSGVGVSYNKALNAAISTSKIVQ